MILANHVVLASGGFENNERMRKQHQDIGTEWTVGAKANTGDGIEAGQRAGAAVGLMDDAWWGPSVPLPRGPFFLLAERSLPGCVLVDKTGRRFVNEAAPYIDVVNAMTGDTWLVFDHSYRSRYPFCGIPPRRPLPAAGRTPCSPRPVWTSSPTRPTCRNWWTPCGGSTS